MTLDLLLARQPCRARQARVGFLRPAGGMALAGMIAEGVADADRRGIMDRSMINRARTQTDPFKAPAAAAATGAP
jgi:hypothetical protein